jgi:hypothetical protein
VSAPGVPEWADFPPDGLIFPGTDLIFEALTSGGIRAAQS